MSIPTQIQSPSTKRNNKLFLYFFVFTIMFTGIPVPRGGVIYLGPLPAQNYFFLGCVSIAYFYLIKRKLRISYAIIFTIFVAYLSVLGYIHNNHQFFSYKFLFQDIGTLLGLVVGYVLAIKYPFKVLMSKVFFLCKICAFFLILSFLLLDFGIYPDKGMGDRRLLLSDFVSSSFLGFIILVVFFYLKKFREPSTIWWIYFFFVVLFIFSIRSGTRSTLLFTVYSFLVFLVFNKKIIHITVLLLLFAPILIAQAENLVVFNRLMESDIGKDPRYFEAAWLLLEFQNSFPITGAGLGVGIMKDGGLFDRVPVFYAHIGILNFLYKGGVLFSLFILYPLVKSTYYLITKKDKYFQGILFFSLLFFYIQSTLSGGYIFGTFLLLGMVVGFMDKKFV